jgi:hypothetical protein
MTRPIKVSHRVAIGLVVALFLVSCAHPNRLGPSTPTGATILGGPNMTSAPPPPPGWTERPVIPASQQQAQDTVIGYLTKTLQELPPGVALDATRYSGGTNTAPCQDVETGTSPNNFTTIGDLKLPPGTSPDAVIAHAGEIWKRWGWHVVERDGFYKPNQFGYGPDGYRLQIMAAAKPGYPPSLESVSPCFPADLPDDRRPFPTVITAG